MDFRTPITLPTVTVPVPQARGPQRPPQIPNPPPPHLPIRQHHPHHRLAYRNRNNVPLTQFNYHGGLTFIPTVLAEAPHFNFPPPGIPQPPPQNIPVHQEPAHLCRCGRCMRCTQASSNLYPGESHSYQNEMTDGYPYREQHDYESLAPGPGSFSNFQGTLMEEQQKRMEAVELDKLYLERVVNYQREEIKGLKKVLDKRDQMYFDLFDKIKKEQTNYALLKKELRDVEDKLMERTGFLNQINKQSHEQYEKLKKESRRLDFKLEMYQGLQNYATTTFGVPRDTSNAEEAVIDRVGPHQVVINRRRKEEKSSGGVDAKCGICKERFAADKDLYKHLQDVHFSGIYDEEQAVMNEVKQEGAAAAVNGESDQAAGEDKAGNDDWSEGADTQVLEDVDAERVGEGGYWGI